MRIIVGMPNHSIEDPFVIDQILSHLEGRGSQESATRRAGARAPPPAVCSYVCDRQVLDYVKYFILVYQVL
jgi:hypothetical protein